MKTLLRIAVATVLVVGGGGTAQATVLTFETVDTGFDDPIGSISDVAPGYGGFSWENMLLIDPAAYGGLDTSGMTNGLSDDGGTYVAFNGFGGTGTLTLSSVGSFDFVGTYMTAAFRSGLLVEVDGFLNGSFVGSESIVVSWDDGAGAAPATWWSVGLLNVDELVFSASGGTADGPGGFGTQFVMDDFTFTNPSTVPEPVSMIMLGALGVGMVGARRMRRKNRA